MKTVTVENVIIGQGRPKIIVPIVGETSDDILLAAREAHDLDCDIIEWRIDFYEEVTLPSKVAKLSHEVKKEIKKPLLITFRTKKEGGELEISDKKYFEIYLEILKSGIADLIDIELFMPADEVSNIIDLAHDKNIKVIMCNHDFDATPDKEEIISRLTAMQEKNADICKIAVMPKTNQDVLTLLEATREMKLKSDRPLITMSMGALGMVSRISGEAFGSSATFGAAKKASAPGQIPVSMLRDILDTFALE